MIEKIKITEIVITDRIRKDPGNLEELASSIARLGLLQPIILGDDNELLAGGRRLAAVASLGWPEIPFVRYSNTDAVIRREIELEENLRRKELSWPEEVRALRQLYELRDERAGLQNLRGKYTLEEAAKDIDKSLGSISMDIALAKALDEFPELEHEQTKSAAWKRFKRAKETQIRQEQANRTRGIADQLADESPATITEGDAPASPNAQVQGHQPKFAHIRKASWKGHGSLYLGDSREILRQLPDNLVDVIVTDPPFALGMFKEGQATSGTRLAEHAGTMYDDDPHAVMDMLDECFHHCARILKPDGHAYVFFHMTRYEPIYLMLEKHFGKNTCTESPIIWVKNTPGIGDPNIMWVYAYEPCFWINRGRHLIRPQAFNYLRYDTIPPSQKIHPTEKPIQLMRHIVSASALQGETVMDPFAGSGSTLCAAAQLGCTFLGIEQHEPFHRAAAERISEEIAKITGEPNKEIPNEQIDAEVGVSS